MDTEELNNSNIIDELERLKAENKKLKELVRIDELTGYFNFRYLQSSLKTEMERSRRTDLPTSLIMADLDRFKDINDKFGHEIGNLALKHATKIWRKHLRKIDIPCRYGGEEFLFILPETRVLAAVRVAERFRAALSAKSLKTNKHLIKLTASFGVDCFLPNETISKQKFIDRTDKLMLQAKQKGRNCVYYDKNRRIDTPTEVSIEEKKQLLF